jgi:hypothetical protein
MIHCKDSPTLSEASITALALEETLLRRWSEFYTLAEQFQAPPATREQVDRFRDYAHDEAFVNSVVDALSLYLAGRSDFDAKFVGYLELILMHRAQAEDVAILERLAAKHDSDRDFIHLMGLLHKLRLHGGDERLTPLAATAAKALEGFGDVTDNTAWVKSIGIEPSAGSWSLGLRLGTAPVNYWIARKFELKPRDVSMELLATHDRQWRVQVARVDRKYSAQWRPSGVTVDTEELKLKSPASWPKMPSLQLFPLFAQTLADFLQVSWVRVASLSAKNVKVDKQRLLEWLHPSVDDVVW